MCRNVILPVEITVGRFRFQFGDSKPHDETYQGFETVAHELDSKWIINWIVNVSSYTGNADMHVMLINCKYKLHSPARKHSEGTDLCQDNSFTPAPTNPLFSLLLQNRQNYFSFLHRFYWFFIEHHLLYVWLLTEAHVFWAEWR